MKREMQRDILIWMLGQVYRAEKRKRELTDRLMRINAERNAPIGSPGYDPLPRVAEPGAGAASILLKLAEIEERIYGQKKEIEKAYVRVMDIIDFIPQADTARRIFELRHLDCMRFAQISEAIPMSKSRCYELYNEAIDKLLEFPKICAMISECESQYLDWYVKTSGKKKRKPGIESGN